MLPHTLACIASIEHISSYFGILLAAMTQVVQQSSAKEGEKQCRVGKSGEKEVASLKATVVKEKASRAVSGELYDNIIIAMC